MSEQISFQKRVVGLYSSDQLSEIKTSQLQKLTHAVFTFINMDADGTIGFANDPAKERRFYQLERKCEESNSIIPSCEDQNSKVKLMISIGGPDHSQSKHFSPVLADPELRKKFINSIITFLGDNNLDGVDIFWAWPRESEKCNYTDFLRELREKTDKKCKCIISIVAPNAGINHWEHAFDWDALLQYVDFVNVFTMNYYGPWRSEYGHPAGPLSPLYSGVGEKKHYNVNYTMQHYKSQTSNPSKFNIILPFYVRLWRNCLGALADGKEAFRNVNLIDGKASGIPYMTRWTVEHDQWDLRNVTWDEESKTSYVYDETAKTFFTFETEQSIAAKIDYVKKENFGGIWIWCVDHDDARSSLLNAVASHNLPSVGLGNDNNSNG